MKTFRLVRQQSLFSSHPSNLAQRYIRNPSKRFLFSRPHRPSQQQTRHQIYTSQIFSYFQTCRSPIFRCLLRQIRSYSSTPPPKFNPTPHLNSPESSLSLSQRMRKLSREYGWSAAGVYLALSAIDLPFSFLAVRMLGTERVAYWEHVAIDAVKTVLKYPTEMMGWSEEDLKGMGRKVLAMVGQDQDGVKGFAKPEEVEQPAGQTWGVEEAETAANKHDATIWTQLALAYAIHKSFIFVRVPLTVAATPKVVKVLRGWGWNIGKRRPKPIDAKVSKGKD